MRETARVQVVEPGLSTVQDLGRADGPRSGQMAGGALDQYSARMANTLVASDPDAALLELVALDFAATTDADLLVAVTGADADVTVDGHPQPQWEPVVWRAGTRLAVRRIRSGLRVYLAVHGTVHTRRLLGSCAPDTVLGFGAPLGADAVLTVAVDCPPVVQPWFDIPFFRLGARPHPYSGRWNVDLTDGPDVAEFGPTAARLFRRRLRRRRPQQPHRAAPAPGRPRAAARPRGRDRGAVARRAGRRGRGARRRRAAGAAPRARRHRGLPGARRRHQRGAVPRSGRPAPATPSASATSPAPPRSRTTGASRPTSPRSAPASRPSTPVSEYHCTSQIGTSQIGTAIHTRTSTTPSATAAPGVSVTTSHPPTAGLPNTPVAERPNVAKVVAAGCVGIFVELYDNGIFAFMATALAIVFFGVTSPSNAIALVFAGYAISFFVRPLGAIVCGILGDRIGRQRAPGVRHRPDQRGHRGASASCPPTRPSASPPPILLITLRVAQGFSVGGEAAGAMTLPRRTRARRAPRPDHQLRPDRVVPRPAHRHPGRLRHVAVAHRPRSRAAAGEPSPGASRSSWRSPWASSAIYIRKRIARHPELQPAQGVRRAVAQPAPRGLRHPRAPPRDAARPVHPADERLRLLRAVLLHADVPQEPADRLQHRHRACSSPQPAWSPSRSPSRSWASCRTGSAASASSRAPPSPWRSPGFPATPLIVTGNVRARHPRRLPHGHHLRGPHRGDPHPASSSCSPPGSATPPTAWATTSPRRYSAAPLPC